MEEQKGTRIVKVRPVNTLKSQVRRVCLALIVAVGVLGNGKPTRPVGSPESILAPCYAPTQVDTAGWQTGHLFTQRLAYRFPATFRPDTTARFQHGGLRWIDGPRKLEQINGVFWSGGIFPVGTPGVSECPDTIAGNPYRFITTFSTWDRTYKVAITRATRDSGRLGDYSEALICSSPDSADQRLFLAILRTLRPDTQEQPK